MNTSMFTAFPLPANVALFGIAAAVVWIAGVKLTYPGGVILLFSLR